LGSSAKRIPEISMNVWEGLALPPGGVTGTCRLVSDAAWLELDARDPNSQYAPATSPPNAAVNRMASSHVGSARPRAGGGGSELHGAACGAGAGSGGGGGGA
jgi:hypothetical protein